MCGTSTNNTGSLQRIAKSTNMAAESLKAQTSNETDIYPPYQEYKQMMQSDPNFDTLTPTKRTARLNEPHIDRHIADRLLKTGYKTNILRGVKGSLPSAEPGVNNYIRFCKLVRGPFFPVSEKAAELQRQLRKDLGFAAADDRNDATVRGLTQKLVDDMDDLVAGDDAAEG